MRRRLFIAGVVSALALGLAPMTAAHAVATDGGSGSATITAALTGTFGLRYVSAVAGNATTNSSTGAILTSPAPAISAVTGSASLSTPVFSQVTETAATGGAHSSPWVNQWSVEAAFSGLTQTLDANGAAVTGTPATISNSAFAMTNKAVTQFVSGGSDSPAADSAGSAISAGAVNWFTNTGQSQTQTYTGLHNATASVSLTPPNGASLGTYTATLTVTLVQ
jgi:hypothetical protein